MAYRLARYKYNRNATYKRAIVRKPRKPKRYVPLRRKITYRRVYRRRY